MANIITDGRLQKGTKGKGTKSLRIKRVYDPPDPGDGQRVLVDRVWPRGISKIQLADAIWLKEVAPSNELRKWFDHRPVRWNQFCIRYATELDRNLTAVETLRAMCKRGSVTLLYSARDPAHNQALALVGYLRTHRK